MASHARHEERRSRRSVWPTVVAALTAAVVIVLAGGLLLGVGPLASCGRTEEAEQPEEQVAQPVEEAPAEVPEEQEQPEQPAQEEAPAYDPSTDWRNAEFAVDPNRTDWNFEAPETKTVYLTFDDGPSANTAAVLDILDQYGIKATFFVTGINPDYLDMIGECYRRGHTIGMHTYTHDYAQVYASVDAYWDDLGQISEVVRQQIGYVPCFIRFPGGSSNTVSANYTLGIMTELTQEVVAAGYQYYDWDASCGDGAVHTADELVEATMADTAYGYQSIVFLAHDGAEKQTTVEALPRIIEYFQSEGYSFAPLDRQTCVPHHGLGN